MVKYTRQSNFTALMVFKGLTSREDFFTKYPLHSIGSLNLRIENYKFMSGLNNIHGISHDAREVYTRYNDVSDQVLLYLYEHFLAHV